MEPVITKKGDWIDLYVPKYPEYDDDRKLLDLGIAIKLPPGYEAILAMRSSSYTRMGWMMGNGIGIIDNTYCGDQDVWKVSVHMTRRTTIDEKLLANARLVQFRIQLSQKATFWQKLKWLFTSGIELKEVDHLSSTNRGGFGSTGR